MVRDAACPMPIDDPTVMRYIGKRTKYQIQQMTNARYGEVYYCTDDTLFYLSTGGNDWLTWAASSVTPTSDIDVYWGALNEIPTSASVLATLTKKSYKSSKLEEGVETTIKSNDQYVVIAYKKNDCTLTSIKQGGIETISGFDSVLLGEYTFYYTPEVVYDPDGEIQYTLTWEV